VWTRLASPSSRSAIAAIPVTRPTPSGRVSNPVFSTLSALSRAIRQQFGGELPIGLSRDKIPSHIDRSKAVPHLRTAGAAGS
jgi:hypothetical protein